MTLKICACLGKCSNSGFFPGTGADERDLAVCAGRRAALRHFLLAGVGFFRAPSISLLVHTSTGRSGGQISHGSCLFPHVAAFSRRAINLFALQHYF